jgi:parallel beta-helix repeat (two copies)
MLGGWIRRNRITLSCLGVLAAIAAAVPKLVEWRPPPPEHKTAHTFLVMSPLDSGDSSLRNAFIRANRVQERLKIECYAKKIELETPLPPLVNTHGLIIQAAEPGACEIDAHQVKASSVIEIQSPDSIIAGLSITGAKGAAVLVRGNRIRLEGLLLHHNHTGVLVAEKSNELTIRNSIFEANQIGLSLTGGNRKLEIRDNQFRTHQQAALWAVGQKPLLDAKAASVRVSDNQFTEDELSALFINVPVTIERNRFRGAKTAAIYVSGPSIMIRENRITNGASVGIKAEAVSDGLIERNEIDGNGAGGILLRYSTNTVVEDNRLYRNVYGIITLGGDPAAPNLLLNNLLLSQSVDAIYVIDSSPVLRGNQVRDNQKAALRIVESNAKNGRHPRANPLLQQNIFEKNGFDKPIREKMQAPPEEKS